MEIQETTMDLGKNKYFVKFVSLCGFSLMICLLIFSAIYVNKNLYIKAIIKEAPVIEAEETTEKKNDIEQFTEITKEQMLDYLEKEYGRKFWILEYETGGLLEREGMRAYPLMGDDLLDTFTITKQEDGTYKDTYRNVYSRSKVKDRVEEVINKLNHIKNKSRYIHAEVEQIKKCNLDVIDKEDVSNLEIKANVKILMNAEEVNKEKINRIKGEIQEQLNYETEGIRVEVYLIHTANFDHLNEYNFDKYLTSPYLATSTEVRNAI